MIFWRIAALENEAVAQRGDRGDDQAGVDHIAEKVAADRNSQGPDEQPEAYRGGEPMRAPATRLRRVLYGSAALELIAFPTVFTGSFLHHVMIIIFMYALMAQSWNVLAGFCG